MERGLHLKPDECPSDQAKHTSKRIPTSPDGPCSPNLIGRRICPANGRHPSPMAGDCIQLTLATIRNASVRIRSLHVPRL